MSSYSTLAKNVGILTIANFGTKFLSFLLVPLYTSVLSTSDYGTYDLVSNTVSVLIPILTSNMVDAVLRFSIDRDVGRDSVIGVGIKHLLIALAIAAAALAVNAAMGLSPALGSLSPYVFMVFATQASSQILLYYARGLNRFTDVAVSSVLCSAAVIGANIVFLVVLRLGLEGYFLANILGPALQVLYLAVRLKLKRVRLRGLSRSLERRMVSYSRPLIANAIAWWVNNVSDRYVVTLVCGVAVNGVYSVAFKIPSILSILQTVIGQAWTVSAVDEFDPEDGKGFFSDVYALYNSLMVIACSAVIALDLPLAGMLYANDFFEAWRYVPLLTVSVVFGAMAGYVGGILAAVKDSAEFARSSVIGAIANIVLNVVTVPLVGPMGSAAATAFSYWLTWLLRMRRIRKYIRLKLALRRDCASYVVLVLQGILLLALHDVPVTMYLSQALSFCFVVALYRGEIGRAVRMVYGKLKG